MIIIQKPDGSYQHNDYNASNELVKISVYNKLDQLLYESVYNYDDRGNLISENELTTLLSRTSTYDQSNQLVAHASMLDQTPLNNYNFSYDDAGNILSLQKNDLSNSFLYTSSNRIMSVDGQNAEYDNDGNLTMITLDGVTKNYQYDSRNRLISDSTLLYGYDSENKRVSKTNGADITNYTINVNGRLPEVLVKTVNGESTYFVYGIGLISQEKGSDYSVYHYDYRGNTVLITDMSGQVTDSFIYGPYGTIEDRTGNSDIDFLFSGQLGIETDENGLVYLNDRYYDPSVGRFLNEDPYSLKYQDILNLNLYSYCANDPLNNVDPTGNYIETIIDIVSVISSAVEFYKNPTIFSFSFLVADTVAALLPGAVAPSAVSKGIRWGDEAVLAFKGGLNISDDTLKWLNKGGANTSVYYGVKNGEEVYTGITKQELAKRLYQHNYNGKGFETLVEQVSGLTKNQARAIEQYLIENGPANALNKANSISPNSKYYTEALQWAEDYINKLK